jgi:hypothetical protein
MRCAALIAWIATAGAGFVMLAIWLARGGMRQRREEGTRIRPPLILGHFVLAATGLVVWIVYLANDNSTLAWIAFALLAVVALLGFAMFAIWYQRRQRGPAAATGRDGLGRLVRDAARTALPGRDRRPPRPTRGHDRRAGPTHSGGRRRQLTGPGTAPTLIGWGGYPPPSRSASLRGGRRH